MRYYKILFFLFTLASCEKDPFRNFDCSNLLAGLKENTETTVKIEIEKMTADLVPAPQPDDLTGHEMNLQILIQRINTHCSLIEASIVCYACIETYPPMSEIRLEYDLNGEKTGKTVDIVTPDDGILHFGGLHD